MSVSSELFCTAAIPNVTDIAMHILYATRRTCTTTYSLIKAQKFVEKNETD